jgi:hypothetical protein
MVLANPNYIEDNIWLWPNFNTIWSMLEMVLRFGCSMLEMVVLGGMW